MLRAFTDIDVDEIPTLIKGLREFLGRDRLNAQLHKYKNTILKLKNTPIYRDYYIKKRHPWWPAFLDYKDMKRKRHHRHSFPLSVDLLAYDAKKILTLKKNMPQSIREKYISAFLDENSVKSYLFEIEMAWFFYRKGWEINWITEQHKKHPEFIVEKLGHKIQVECKKIGVDTALKFKRSDFYKLVDFLVGKLQKTGLTGTLEIIFTNSSSINDERLREIAKEVFQLAVQGKEAQTFTIGNDISVSLDLFPRNNIIVDENEIWNDFYRRKIDGWHGIVLFGRFNGYSVDPLEISVQFEKGNSLLKTIYNILKNATKNQLQENVPGFLACHLSEIPNFEGLEYNSGLSSIAEYLFKNKKAKNLVGISFVSDMHVHVHNLSSAIVSRTPALYFKNEESDFAKKIHLDFS